MAQLFQEDNVETTTRQDVNASVRAYFEALNGNDVEGVLDLFTDDAVAMVNDAETAIGTEQLRAVYEYGFTVFHFGRKVHVDESMVEEDLAVLRCHSTGSFTFLATGHAIEAVAREIFVLRRHADSWKIRCYMNNMPKSPS